MTLKRVVRILSKTEPILKELRTVQKSISKKIKPQETDPIMSHFEANACLEEAIWGIVYCQRAIVSTIDTLEARNEKTKGHKKKEGNR